MPKSKRKKKNCFLRSNAPDKLQSNQRLDLAPLLNSFVSKNICTAPRNGKLSFLCLKITINMFILEKNGNIDHGKKLAGSQCQKNRLALSLGGETD